MGQALGCIQVKKSTMAVSKRFEKFDKVLEPGCHFLPRCLGYRVKQLKVKFEIKTKDNVSVRAVASIPYRVSAEEAPDKLTDTNLQILSDVVDAVRASVSKLDLGAVLEHKKSKAKAAGEGLEKAISACRFEISQTLTAEFQKAMNASDAAGRQWLVIEEKALALSYNVPGTTSKDVTGMPVVTLHQYGTVKGIGEF